MTTATERGAGRLPAMTENDLQTSVVKMARLLGWRTYHTAFAIRSDRGFPDLTMVRGDRLIFAELKRDGRFPTDIQNEWLDDLRRCAVEVRVWWPRDWLDGTIEGILR